MLKAVKRELAEEAAAKSAMEENSKAENPKTGGAFKEERKAKKVKSRQKKSDAQSNEQSVVHNSELRTANGGKSRGSAEGGLHDASKGRRQAEKARKAAPGAAQKEVALPMNLKGEMKKSSQTNHQSDAGANMRTKKNKQKKLM